MRNRFGFGPLCGVHSAVHGICVWLAQEITEQYQRLQGHGLKALVDPLTLFLCLGWRFCVPGHLSQICVHSERDCRVMGGFGCDSSSRNTCWRTKIPTLPLIITGSYPWDSLVHTHVCLHIHTHENTHKTRTLSLYLKNTQHWLQEELVEAVNISAQFSPTVEWSSRPSDFGNGQYTPLPSLHAETDSSLIKERHPECGRFLLWIHTPGHQSILIWFDKAPLLKNIQASAMDVAPGTLLINTNQVNGLAILNGACSVAATTKN